MENKKTNMKPILIIYTGGTIGMMKDEETSTPEALRFSHIITLYPD